MICLVSCLFRLSGCLLGNINFLLFLFIVLFSGDFLFRRFISNCSCSFLSFLSCLFLSFKLLLYFLFCLSFSFCLFIILLSFLISCGIRSCTLYFLWTLIYCVYCMYSINNYFLIIILLFHYFLLLLLSIYSNILFSNIWIIFWLSPRLLCCLGFFANINIILGTLLWLPFFSFVYWLLIRLFSCSIPSFRGICSFSLFCSYSLVINLLSSIPSFSCISSFSLCSINCLGIDLLCSISPFSYISSFSLCSINSGINLLSSISPFSWISGFSLFCINSGINLLCLFSLSCWINCFSLFGINSVIDLLSSISLSCSVYWVRLFSVNCFSNVWVIFRSSFLTIFCLWLSAYTNIIFWTFFRPFNFFCILFNIFFGNFFSFLLISWNLAINIICCSFFDFSPCILSNRFRFFSGSLFIYSYYSSLFRFYFNEYYKIPCKSSHSSGSAVSFLWSAFGPKGLVLV